MTIEEAREAASALTNHFGVAVSANVYRDETGEVMEFRPSDFDRNEGFSVRVQVGWRSIEASYIPGSYSATFIAALGQAMPEQRMAFHALAKTISDETARIRFAINGREVSPTESVLWPEQWKSIDLSLKRSPIESSLITPDQVLKWGGRLFGLILCLAPIEEFRETADSLSPGLPEGARATLLVNRYERSRINRAVCIELSGTICVVCGFDFGHKYGALGAGYIHVHHVVPVSQLGDGYVINPAKDLVPICPNCHAMVHRTDPPLSVADLKELIETMQRDLVQGDRVKNDAKGGTKTYGNANNNQVDN